MRELTMEEIAMIDGGAMSNAEYAAFLGGVASAYAGLAAVPTPLSPVLGAIAGFTGVAAAFYTYRSLQS